MGTVFKNIAKQMFLKKQKCFNVQRLYAHLPVHSSETRPIMTFFLVLRSL